MQHLPISQNFTLLDHSSIMSNTERKIDVLKSMLDKVGKTYVCPACLRSYKKFKELKRHISQEAIETHNQGLLNGEESEFRRSYQDVIGWIVKDKDENKDEDEDENKKFILPRKRSQAFERDFVVKIRVRVSQTEDPLELSFQTYLNIAVNLGMTLVCPQCLDTDYEFFSKPADFKDHCWKKGDQTHLDFLSGKEIVYLPSYLVAMGRLEIENPPPGSQNPGPRTISRHLDIRYVFKEKSFLPHTV